MKRKLSGWWRAAGGAVAVLLLAWASTSVYTFLETLDNTNRITKIEERVVGVGLRKAVRRKGSPAPIPQDPKGGDAHQTPSTAHQQPGPGRPGRQAPPVSGNATPTEAQPSAPSSSQAPLGQTAPTDKGPVEKTVEPVVESVQDAIGGATGEAGCPLNKNC